MKLSGGERVPVDDVRNLQALCSRCNRGKRDTSTYDFRPTQERLAETVALALAKARDEGYDPAAVIADAEKLGDSIGSA